MLRVGGDDQHSLRGRAEQQVVDQRLVVEGDVSDLGGQREDDVEIADRQQVSLALGQPCARGSALTLSAVAVAAAIVGDAPVAAVLASFNVTAKRCGAAGLDRRHDLQVLQAQVPGMDGPVFRSSATEDVGDLKVSAHGSAVGRRLFGFDNPQPVERADHGAHRARGDPGIERGRLQLRMAQRPRFIMHLTLTH